MNIEDLHVGRTYLFYRLYHDHGRFEPAVYLGLDALDVVSVQFLFDNSIEDLPILIQAPRELRKHELEVQIEQIKDEMYRLLNETVVLEAIVKDL